MSFKSDDKGSETTSSGTCQTLGESIGELKTGLEGRRTGRKQNESIRELKHGGSGTGRKPGRKQNESIGELKHGGCGIGRKEKHEGSGTGRKLGESAGELKSRLDGSETGRKQNESIGEIQIGDSGSGRKLDEYIGELKTGLDGNGNGRVLCESNGELKVDLDGRKLEPARTKKRFRYLGQVYSKAHGSYVSWETDVNLDVPVALGKKVSADSKFAHEYYTALQYTLFETNYPETVDRTASPRTQEPEEGVTVAILSSPAECIGLLLEGGKRCPDAFVLILSTSWVRKVRGGDGCSFDLLVYKGITFGRGGATYIDEFNPPRRCTYLLNFFTGNVTRGQRDDGTELENNLDCPMCGSVELVTKVDDKLWTTAIMAEVGMNFPEFLAFRYRPDRKYVIPRADEERIRVVDVEDKKTGEGIVMTEVGRFLKQEFMQRVEKIVVKPSGAMLYGSIDVSIHRRENLADIAQAAISILRDLEPRCSVLVESFIEPLRARETCETRTELQNQKYEFRCRVNVSRDFADNPKATLVTCGVNLKDTPINGDIAVVQSLESTLLAFGVTDQSERSMLRSNLERKCEDVMCYIMNDEALHKDNRRARAMTDIIGIDLVVTDGDEGELTFVGIEVNSHDCIINCHVMEFITCLVEREPRCFRPTVEMMVTRSQRYLMEGKRVLVIGGGCYSKRGIFTSAKEHGVKVILVDSASGPPAAFDVNTFIHYNFTDHNLDTAHARNIINLLRCADLDVDGCLTFWEDCVPLASAVSELLETRGNCLEAAMNAKQKSRTHSVLISRGDVIPHWPRTCHYASHVHKITCTDDIVGMDLRVNFPCMLKLEHGSASVGVFLCNSLEDIVSNFNTLTSRLTEESNCPGIGLGFGNAMMLMDRWTGTEHDINIVIYNRKLLAAIVIDNGPTAGISFADTTACMPSQLPEDKQGQLIAAAYQCCTEIGLENGVFNVEMMMTDVGPKLIEINARMGGFYMQNWSKRLYGIDFAFVSMAISCDIKPYVPKPETTECIVGIILVSSCHKHILKDSTKLEELRTMHQDEEIIFSEFAHYEEVSDIYEEPVANVAVICCSVEECKKRLVDICERFEIATDEYDAKSLISSL